MTANNKTTHPLPASDRVGLSVQQSTEGVRPVSHDNQWNEKVQRGRALVSEINDRKWELGDLANEVCPASTRGVSNDGQLGRFAEEIGVAASTLREYRRVASAWPNAMRVAFQTWTTHRLLADHEDRFAVIIEQTWTYNSLTEHMGRLPNPSRTVPPNAVMPVPAADVPRHVAVADTETKRKIFRELSRDKSVVDDAITRLEASKNIDKASSESDVSSKMRRADDNTEAAGKERGDLRFTMADGSLIAAKRKIRQAIMEIHEATISDEHRDLLRERIAEIIGLTDLMRTEVDGNAAVDWDAEMASLMGGES